MPQTVIQANDVHKTYVLGSTEVRALRGISLTIEQGDFLAIMGHSGSGKSTLLDILTAMSRPTKGEVTIKGKKVSQMTDSELARIRGRTIGFVFQTFNLIPRLNALENVSMPLWFNSVPKEKRLKIGKKMLEEVGLKDRIYHKPAELSGGQRQRVAIARALATNPEIIVADEPTGNLDSASGDQILEIMAKLNKEGKTIMMVTHEKSVADMAKKIIYIKDGLIQKIENESGVK